jgi:hypothetical protein
MRWFKKMIWRWSYQGREMAEENCKVPSRGQVISTRDSHELDGEPLRFNIFRANGGTVVQTHIYDRQKDRSLQQLHIIGHDQDLGTSLAKIITMESLRG